MAMPSTPAADPTVLARMHRRRRARRVRSVALLGLVLAASGVVGWRVARQMIATTWLLADQVEVDWNVSGADWTEGGTTHVFSSTRTLFNGAGRPVPDLRYLGWLVHVSSLDLSEVAGLGDDDLAVLDRLPGLVSIRLDRPANLPEHKAAGLPRLTDRTIGRLKGMRRLEDLSMVGQNVTDAGLESLVGLERLEQLNLDGNEITDAGLKTLLKLKNLKSISLAETAVTAEAARDFEVARPGVAITLGLSNQPTP